MNYEEKIRRTNFSSAFFEMFNRIKKINRGFTLVELLVTIAIIGILSAVVLTSMSGARERAKDGRRISDIKQIQLALELYYDVNTQYPIGIYSDELVSFLKVSHDPSGSDVEYKYAQLDSGQDYHLGAILQQYNKLLEEDDDHDSSLAGGFDGESEDCAGGGTSDMCYDVTP